MVRLLVFALLIYLGYRFLKSRISSMLTPGEDATRLKTPGGLQDAEMIRDPQCGVYFLKNQGVAARVQGETLHFCSTACRDSYLKNKQSR